MSQPPPRASYAPGARLHSDQELEAAILHNAHASLEHMTPRILVRLLKRVIEVLQEMQEYGDTQSTCQECGAHCPRVCARADLHHRHCRCYSHQMADMHERAEWNQRQKTWVILLSHGQRLSEQLDDAVSRVHT